MPMQVPAEGAGRYSKVERYFREPEQARLIRGKFSSFLIKLNCYEDIRLSLDGENYALNPDPEDICRLIESAFEEHRQLSVILERTDAMITFDGDDHYLTFYNPSGELLELSGQIASSEGLFIWKHPDISQE